MVPPDRHCAGLGLQLPGYPEQTSAAGGQGRKMAKLRNTDTPHQVRCKYSTRGPTFAEATVGRQLDGASLPTLLASSMLIIVIQVLASSCHHFCATYQAARVPVEYR
jgi:hypothetical protein